MIKYNQTQKANIINRTNEIKALQEQKAAHNEKVNFYTTDLSNTTLFTPIPIPNISKEALTIPNTNTNFLKKP